MKQVKIIRSDLQLETCGETGKNYKKYHTHENGCHIRFSNEIITHSKPRHDTIVDYDEDNNIVGIEFYDGL